MRLRTSSWIAGMRVAPPTSTMWSILSLLSPASLIAWSKGPRHASTRSAVSSWNLDRVNLTSRCLGPSLVAVMKGRLIVGLLHGGELDLGLLSRFLQPLQRHLVVGEVDALGVLERLHQPVDHPLVPVVAAQVGIAAGRLDLEDALADLEDRNVERAAAEVEHEDRLLRVLLVEPIGQGGRGRLVDDPQHLEAGDLACLLGCGPLGVVEVRGDGDHGLGDGGPEIALGVPLQLLQDASGDLLGRIAPCRRC